MKIGDSIQYYGLLFQPAFDRQKTMAGKLAKKNHITKREEFRRKSKAMERDKAIDTIKELPKEFELDILLERLVFIDKIEQGLTQVKQKKLVSHSTVKDIVKKW